MLEFFYFLLEYIIYKYAFLLLYIYTNFNPFVTAGDNAKAGAIVGGVIAAILVVVLLVIATAVIFWKLS